MRFVATLFLCALVSACAAVPALAAERGIASIYGNGDGYAWRKTASGVPMNPSAMIAAHKTLKFGTMVTVTNERNGRTVVVKIVDRGPFIRGRIIDLSPAAARALGFDGLAPVTVR